MKPLWITFGSAAVFFGVLGIALPLLPTTPFLLMAAFCYAKGSPKLHDWLLGHRWFGAYVRNWREGHGIDMRSKILAVALITTSIGSSILRLGMPWFVNTLLAFVGVAMSLYLITRPTAQRT